MAPNQAACLSRPHSRCFSSIESLFSREAQEAEREQTSGYLIQTGEEERSVHSHEKLRYVMAGLHNVSTKDRAWYCNSQGGTYHTRHIDKAGRHSGARVIPVGYCNGHNCAKGKPIAEPNCNQGRHHSSETRLARHQRQC